MGFERSPAVFSLLLLVASACGGSEQPTVSARATTVGDVGATLAPGQLVELSMPPLEEREGAAIDLNAGRALFLGGYTASDGRIHNRNDGAVLDVATQEWQRIPDAPFSAAVFGPLVVWTGQEWIVGRQPCARLVTELESAECPPAYEAVAYDPAANTWRELSPPPYEAAGGTPGSLYDHGWTGSEAVFSDQVDVFLYQPERDTWRTVALPAVSGSGDPTLCVVGGHSVFAANQRLREGEALSSPSPQPIRTWMLDGDAPQWRELPQQDKPIPADELSADAVTCLGNELIYEPAPKGPGVGEVGDGMLWFDADVGPWDPVPDPDLTFGSARGASRTDDGARLLWPDDRSGSGLLRLDPGSSTWTRLPSPVDGLISQARISGDVFLIRQEAADGSQHFTLFRAASAP